MVLTRRVQTRSRRYPPQPNVATTRYTSNFFFRVVTTHFLKTCQRYAILVVFNPHRSVVTTGSDNNQHGDVYMLKHVGTHVTVTMMQHLRVGTIALFCVMLNEI